MRIFGLVSSLILFSYVAWADAPDLDVKPINSPVREHFAKFQFALRSGLAPSDVWYQFRNPQATTSKTPQPTYKIDDSERQIKFSTISGVNEIDVPASELPPGTFQISIRAKISKNLLMKAKELFANAADPSQLHGEASFAIDASLEVPDPGEAGKQTIAGIDSDGDGVRDDIQRWINETYNPSLKQRLSAKQLAKDAQSKMLNTLGKTASIAASNRFHQSMDCVLYVFGSAAAEKQLRQALNAKMQNTNDRILASIQVNQNYKGQFVKIDPKRDLKASCSFDPDSLAN